MKGGKTKNTFRIPPGWVHSMKDSNDNSYERVYLSKLIRAETHLRRQVQLEEHLHHKIKALQKLHTIDPDTKELGKVEEELHVVQSERAKKGYELYKLVFSLPDHLKDAYDGLRRNPKWFMREGMVKDCSARGGCCGRGCGCCEQRSLSDENGRGHCTVNCWCCSSNRKFQIQEADWVFLESLTSVQRVANWYFDPLSTEEISALSRKDPKPKKSPWRKFRDWVS